MYEPLVQEVLSSWDEEITFAGDRYKVKYYPDGSRVMHCPKDEDGFRVTIRIGGTEEEKLMASRALETFIINNML